MAKIFNRVPLSVPTPSANDIKDYFFTHSNFKGLSNDKNFLTADQETFSDCKNVYVDSEGLLKSRPSIVNKIVTINDGGTVLSNILDIWNYGDVTVYKTASYLTFVNDNFEQSVQISHNNTLKLILVEGKIFVFEPNSIRYYDVSTNTVSTNEECITKYVYTPVTKIVTNGVTTNLEPENELTTSHIIKYLFDNVTGNNFNVLLGKNITVKLDNVEYNITFVNDNEKVFVQKLTDASFNYVNVSISNVGSLIIVEEGEESTYDIHYSVDGKLFTTLETLNNVVSIPSISADGHYICYAAEDEIYSCKLVDDEGTGIVSYTWEPTLSKIDASTFEEWKTLGLKFSIVSNIKMLSEDTLATVAYFDTEMHCIVSYAGTLSDYAVEDVKDSFYNAVPESYTKTIDISTELGEIDLDTITFSWTHNTSSLTITLDLKLENNAKILGNTTVFDVRLSGSMIYRYDYVNLGTNAFYNKLLPVNEQLSTSGTIRVGDVDVYTKLTGTSLTIGIWPTSGYIKFDMYYPFGSIHNSYLVGGTNSKFTSPANIDMYAQGTSFVVAVSAGDIFVVDNTCEDRVKFIDSPWKQSYDPLYYGLSVNSDYLYFITKFKISDTLLFKTYKKDNDVYKYYNAKSITGFTKSVTSSSGDVLTENYLYSGSFKIPLLFSGKPIKVTNNGIYLSKDGVIYSSSINKLIEVDEVISGETNYIVPDFISEINNFYFASGKTLYISSYPSDGDFKWYFPKINTEEFDYDISNIHPISATEMAVFLEDSVYYIQTSEQGYLYYKSKIQVGCKKGATVITSFDGKYIIFTSSRGLVAMTYQDFVASTEQTLTYLSDGVHETFKTFNIGNPIQLFKYDFWIICYKQGSNTFLLFDIRNNSWWPMELTYDIVKFVNDGEFVNVLCNNALYSFKYNDDYYDVRGTIKSNIDWYFISQKLHLNAPNYYKHISNITLISVLDSDEDIYLDLTLYNYRKKMHQSEVESFKFNVDSIRTYVKRLNYSKVNEFQYLLTSNVDDAADEEETLNVPKVPLSLSSITVKYKISGQVR